MQGHAARPRFARECKCGLSPGSGARFLESCCRAYTFLWRAFCCGRQVSGVFGTGTSRRGGVCGSRREKSLGILSRRFIAIFLKGKAVISLEEVRRRDRSLCVYLRTRVK